MLEPTLFAVPGGERFVATVFAPAIARYEAGGRAEAVETVLHGVAGETGIAALRRAVPGALELAETDADTLFRTELPALQAWRLTVTPSTIRAARTVFVVVVGEDKHAALRRVLGDAPDPVQAPASLLLDVPGDLAWYVDRAALFGAEALTP